MRLDPLPVRSPRSEFAATAAALVVSCALLASEVAAGGLADHETAEGVVGVATSERFALKWGAARAPSPEDADAALAALEAACTRQVDELGLTRPHGMADARFNVYLAGSGLAFDGDPLRLPPGVGAGYGSDRDGLPYLLVAPDLWVLDRQMAAFGRAEAGELLATALAHEFHHAVQLAAGSYTGGDQHWWWEAMAQWAQDRQVPDSAFTLGPVAILWARPEQALERFDEVAWRGIEEADPAAVQRIYGSGALPLFLEAQGRGDLLVAWAGDAGGESRALDRLATLLAADGDDLGDVMLGMWADLQARWGADAEAADALLDGYAGLDIPVHTPTWSAGADGAFRSPPEGRAPERFGANVLRLEPPFPDALEVALRSDPTGSAATPVRWGAALVVCGAAGCEARPLGVEAAPEPTWRAEVAGADALDVVVVPVTDAYVPSEVFAYEIRVGEPAPDEAGCGCAGETALSGLFGLLPVARRRRRKGVS